MKSRIQRALLALFTIAFVSLFSVGCDSSGNGLVVDTFNTGNLQFQFQRPVTQTVDTVPSGTTMLRFDLFSTNPATEGSLVFSETRDYADQITLTGVPTNVVLVVVTTLDADGLPTAILSAPVQVIVGSTIQVDLNDAVAVTFEALSITPETINVVVTDKGQVETQQLTFTGTFNSEQFALPITSPEASFSFDTPNVGNVSSTGLYTFDTEVHSGPGTNTTLTGNYTFGSTTLMDTVQVFVYGFFPFPQGSQFLVPGDSYTACYGSEFVRPNSIVETPSTFTFALESPVTGVTVDSATGDITTTASTPVGTFKVIVTYNDSTSGMTFQAGVDFTVTNNIM